MKMAESVPHGLLSFVKKSVGRPGMADRRFLYEMAPALVAFSCSVPASIDRNVKRLRFMSLFL